MKHLLLATTALVATAGVAAAETDVTLSAKIGIIGGSDTDTQYFTDWDVDFAGSGETDSGVVFGAEIDLDEAAGLGNEEGNAGGTAFLSFGGATFTMGDTDGALDKAMTEVNLAGASLRDDETTHAGFNANSGFDGLDTSGLGGFANDGQVARLDYSFEGFTASISAEQADLKGIEDGQLIDDAETIWGIGVAYNADLAGLSLGVGLGYQTTEVLDTSLSITGISLSTTFDNGLMAAVNYSMANVEDVDDDPTHWAIGLGYEMGALAVGVNYGEYKDWILSSTPDSSGFGLAATYDMGGGLTAHVGYGSSDDGIDGTDDTDAWSIGMVMSF